MSPRPPLNPEDRKHYKGKKIPAFCANFQSRRLQMGMRQQDLADKLGINRTRISEIESGRFPEDPERIIAIAQALDCSLDWLFGMPGAKAPKKPSP